MLFLLKANGCINNIEPITITVIKEITGKLWGLIFEHTYRKILRNISS